MLELCILRKVYFYSTGTYILAGYQTNFKNYCITCNFSVADNPSFHLPTPQIQILYKQFDSKGFDSVYNNRPKGVYVSHPFT